MAGVRQEVRRGFSVVMVGGVVLGVLTPLRGVAGAVGAGWWHESGIQSGYVWILTAHPPPPQPLLLTLPLSSLPSPWPPL